MNGRSFQCPFNDPAGDMPKHLISAAVEVPDRPLVIPVLLAAHKFDRRILTGEIMVFGTQSEAGGSDDSEENGKSFIVARLSEVTHD